MTGVWLNVAAIVIGGIIGVFRPRAFSSAHEAFFKNLLGAFTVFYGLRLTWLSVNGTVGHALGQLAVMLISLMLGRVIGKLLRLQKLSNRIGQVARERISRATPGDRDRVNTGFQTCAALFCAAPLAIIGSLQGGLSDYYYPLALKSVMDGLAAVGFVSLFGWGVVLAAVPVLAFEGTIALVAMVYLKPALETHGLVDSTNAVGGMLVFCVALLIFGLKRIEVTTYLPSLAVAPLLTWGLRSLG
jgi:uncharacterized membrane protein YqgA involved in biofilm formation